jgi:hypothetical protein
VSGATVSPLNRIGSVLFIVAMIVTTLKSFDLLAFEIPKVLLLGMLLISWVLRELGWKQERSANV